MRFNHSFMRLLPLARCRTVLGRGAFSRIVLSLLLGMFLIPVHAERVITDMAGRQVHLPDTVRRVYAEGHCLALVGAVAPDKLVNAARLSDEAKRLLAPAFTQGKQVPEGGMRFSDEEIVRMAPDLIVLEMGAGVADTAARMQARLHLPVVLVDQDLHHYKQTFVFVGQLLGRPEQGQALANFVATHIDPIAVRAAAIPEAERVRVYYAEGPNGLSTNAAGSAHTQVLEFVGARNAAVVQNVPGEAMNTVSIEQLYVWKPDLILVWTPNADRLLTWHAIVDDPLWQRLDAVRQGRVLQIPWLPFSWFDRPPGSNRLLGVLWLAKTLYPAVYSYDLVALTQSYFKLFYHQEFSAADARRLLDSAHPVAGHPPPGAS